MLIKNVRALSHTTKNTTLVFDSGLSTVTVRLSNNKVSSWENAKDLPKEIKDWLSNRGVKE